MRLIKINNIDKVFFFFLSWDGLGKIRKEKQENNKTN